MSKNSNKSRTLTLWLKKSEDVVMENIKSSNVTSMQYGILGGELPSKKFFSFEFKSQMPRKLP